MFNDANEYAACVNISVQISHWLMKWKWKYEHYHNRETGNVETLEQKGGERAQRGDLPWNIESAIEEKSFSKTSIVVHMAINPPVWELFCSGTV